MVFIRDIPLVSQKCRRKHHGHPVHLVHIGHLVHNQGPSSFTKENSIFYPLYLLRCPNHVFNQPKFYQRAAVELVVKRFNSLVEEEENNLVTIGL